MSKFGILFLILSVIVLVASAYKCQGKINNLEVLDLEPFLVNKVANGTKYVINNNGEKLFIVNITGTPFEMGFAYGSLLKDEIKGIVHAYFSYIRDHVEEEFSFVTKLPKFLQPYARDATVSTLRFILRLNEYITRKYTPARFREEIAGIAAGSGVDKAAIIELNMIPEYTKAGCSVLGAWGKATKDGHLLHLRALDWDYHAPLNEYPAIVVYHPTENGSHPFANVGWAGFVGSITGFSDYVGVGEKLRNKHDNANTSRFGKPWNYAIRDVMQFANNMYEALDQLNQTDRTCSIYLGLGSRVDNTFRLVEYSQMEFNVYDDRDFPYTAIHGQVDDAVYMPIHDDKSECFNDLLREQYGQIDAEYVMNTMAPLHNTGDTQLAVYDYQARSLLLQYSRDGVQAYQRPALRINLGEFLGHI